MPTGKFQRLSGYRHIPKDEMQKRAADFYAHMRRRRTVREFSDQDVDRQIIEACLRTAGTAPSGANQQPWQFVVVSDPSIKKQIREAAEKVERDFYQKESTAAWRNELKNLKTSHNKPFLQAAPYLIVIFSQRFGYDQNGKKKKHYYVSESVGIATGVLITALHQAGLVSLTYTPASMHFLNRILSRPDNEKPFLILVMENDWQDHTYVLRLFADQMFIARKKYKRFVLDGVSAGKQPELTGGGLLRSNGGWAAIKSLRRQNFHLKSDERILGDSDFVEKVLNAAEENLERKYELRSKGYDLQNLTLRVSEIFSKKPDEILRPGKQPVRVKARSLLCFWAVRELGYTMAELALKLDLSQPAISSCVRRGEKIVVTEGHSIT